MKARRKDLQGLRYRDGWNVGLWLDRYVPELPDPVGASEEQKEAARQHIETVAGAKAPAGYETAFERWAGQLPEEWRLRGRVVGRMVIGLGAKGVLETGLTLCRTWGVPKVPGSALKGVAAAAAGLLEGDEWRAPEPEEEREPNAYDTLFGTTDLAGAVVFHDGWWVPEETVPLVVDAITVHHPDYYQPVRPKAPSDFDAPNPVAFASVRGEYLLVVEPRDPETGRQWRQAAVELLAIGLAELGLGAKTNAGYGRLELVDYEAPALQAARAEEAEQLAQAAGEAAAAAAKRAKEEAKAVLRRKEEAERWRKAEADKARRDRLLDTLGRGNAQTAVPELLANEDAEQLRRDARAILDELTRDWLAAPGRRDRDWVRETFEAAGEELPEAGGGSGAGIKAFEDRIKGTGRDRVKLQALAKEVVEVSEWPPEAVAKLVEELTDRFGRTRDRDDRRWWRTMRSKLLQKAR